MRLLVLDGSTVLPELVRRVVPEDVEVQCTESFHGVILQLQKQAPDALIVNVTPASLPWSQIQTLCHEHKPHPIPVLYESCVYSSPQEAGIDELDRYCFFVTKPYHTEELRSYVLRLLQLAGSTALETPTTSQTQTLH